HVERFRDIFCYPRSHMLLLGVRQDTAQRKARPFEDGTLWAVVELGEAVGQISADRLADQDMRLDQGSPAATSAIVRVHERHAPHNSALVRLILARPISYQCGRRLQQQHVDWTVFYSVPLIRQGNFLIVKSTREEYVLLTDRKVGVPGTERRNHCGDISTTELA